MSSFALLNTRQRAAVCSQGRSRTQVRPNALFGKKKKEEATTTVAEPPKERRKENFFSQTISTLEGAVPRSKKDADLLYEAKYGQRAEDGKMTREQYQALRRKIGGTAKDYWKDWVEEERVENTYYKPDDAGGSVPFLPVLVGVLVAVLATTVVVVQQTSV